MRLGFVAVSLFVIATTCVAQDTIKVTVEEVRIPITAKDSAGDLIQRWNSAICW